MRISIVHLFYRYFGRHFVLKLSRWDKKQLKLKDYPPTEEGGQSFQTSVWAISWPSACKPPAWQCSSGGIDPDHGPSAVAVSILLFFYYIIIVLFYVYVGALVVQINSFSFLYIPLSMSNTKLDLESFNRRIKLDRVRPTKVTDLIKLYARDVAWMKSEANLMYSKMQYWHCWCMINVPYKALNILSVHLNF